MKKRVLSMLLTVLLLVGLLPITALADTTSVTVTVDEYGQISGTYDGIKLYESVYYISVGESFENYVYTFSNQNANVGLCLSDNFPYSFMVNYATIDGGKIDMKVKNEGTITGGTFNDTVTNHGSISGGTFNSLVTNYGTITGGTFNAGILNYGGTISNLSGSKIANVGDLTVTTQVLGSGSITVQQNGIALGNGVGGAAGQTYEIAYPSGNKPVGLYVLTAGDEQPSAPYEFSDEINVGVGGFLLEFTMPNEPVTILAVFSDYGAADAEEPSISVQPQSASYTTGATAAALTVEAAVTDGGTLSYQWYSNTADSNAGGTAITNATGTSYTPDVSAAGTTYYYCVVTNTNSSVSGAQTASAVSNTAAITVEAPTAPTITTDTIQSGTVGVAYSQQLTATGTAPITWSIVGDNSLPEGLSLDASTGVISGTPTKAVSTSILVKAENSAGSDDKAYNLSIGPEIKLSWYAEPLNLNFGTAEEGYSAPPAAQTVTVTNNGGSEITLTQPTATNFTVGDLSDTTLAVGETATFTVQPKENLAAGTYQESIVVKGNDDNHYSQMNVSVEFTVVAEPTTYTVSVSANNASYGSVTGGGTFNDGTSVTVTATPNSGYRFVEWSVGGTQVSTYASYTFSISKDIALVAVFEQDSTPPASGYTISVSANNASCGSVSGGGTYSEGESVTITAEPADQCAFLKWVENGADVSFEKTYTFTANRDRSLEAVFTAKVVVRAPREDLVITVNVGEGASLEIEAENANGYSWYVNKNDGNGFVELPNTDSDKYAILNASLENNGWKYYCKCINDADTGTMSPIFTLQVVSNDPASTPVITTTSLPNGTVSSAYSQTLKASGTSPVTWRIEKGSLPDGLIISTDGTISGTPVAKGKFTFTVKATNSLGSDTKELSITVVEGDSGDTPVITTTSLQGGTVGTAYSQTLASNAPSDVKVLWHIAQGKLPDGLTLSTDGVIAGTPTKAGTFPFTVVIFDGAESFSDTQELSITITAGGGTEPQPGNPPVITTPTKTQNVFAYVGNNATMRITAENATSYQWYVDRNDGKGFVAIDGATKTSYTTSAVNLENNGYRYCCVVANDYGAATSPTFTLNVARYTNIPATGDNSSPMLWIGLMVIAAAGMIACAGLKRKKKRN